MSGRSAYVRAKNTERADKSTHRYIADFSTDDLHLHNHSGGPDAISTVLNNFSYISTSRPRRRQSISSTSSTYGYPPPIRRHPPIVVASAIEKSDFRTHFDGMSSSLRGKLGKLLKGGEDSSPSRKKPAALSIGSNHGFRKSDPPSITAVPSLSPSTSPEVPASFAPVVRRHQAAAVRAKQRKEAVIQKIRRFEGGGKMPQLGWKSLSNNPELWDDNGDTFVYMYMRGSRTKPPPSFRINSHVITESSSKGFIDKLFHVTEPEGWPRFYPSDNHSLSSVAPEDDPESFEEFRNGLSASIPGRSSDESDFSHPLNTFRKRALKAPRGIQYELYVPWPGSETGIHSTMWHVTTRNFFAIMYNSSALVGVTLYEAITLLFQRIESNPDYLDENVGKVIWLTDYLVRHKFDDVRNNPSYAASLLAFSEHPSVQWREGYIEAFVHCVGMLNLGLQTISEWRYITPHTKMILQNASMEMEERLHRAQGWLFSFNFTEMWPTTSAPPCAAHGCFERFRKWLCSYYENAFLHWPPTNDQTWLTRDVILRLRDDFYGLYDYFVDREVMFESSFDRTGEKWKIVHKTSHMYRADTSELPLTDILVAFDDRNAFPHIPYPLAHMPMSLPVHNKPKSAFTLKKPISPTEAQAQSRRKILAYSEASNVYTLRDHYMHAELVSSFLKFEQTDMIEGLDPYEARRGRWLLIYGVLQVLATVAVDSPNLRYREGALYHLSPQMKGIVPWAERSSPSEEEAEHKRSHCWTVPGTWPAAATKSRTGSHQPIISPDFGDGRSIGDKIEKMPDSLDSRMASEASIGRKRAEEWVAANHGGHQHHGSDGAMAASDDAARLKTRHMIHPGDALNSHSTGYHPVESSTADRRTHTLNALTELHITAVC